MKLRDTFIFSLAGSPECPWVVSSNPNESGNVVIFSIKSWRENNCDGSCVIDPTEHPFLLRKSTVDYQLGRLLTPAIIEIMDKRGCYSLLEPVSRDLLKRIQQGALDSIFTPQKFQKLVRKSLIS